LLIKTRRKNNKHIIASLIPRPSVGLIFCKVFVPAKLQTPISRRSTRSLMPAKSFMFLFRYSSGQKSKPISCCFKQSLNSNQTRLLIFPNPTTYPRYPFPSKKIFYSSESSSLFSQRYFLVSETMTPFNTSREIKLGIAISAFVISAKSQTA